MFTYPALTEHLLHIGIVVEAIFCVIISLIYLLNIYDILDIAPRSPILVEAIDQTINNRARGVLCQVGKRGEVVITEENEVTPEELCVQSV